MEKNRIVTSTCMNNSKFSYGGIVKKCVVGSNGAPGVGYILFRRYQYIINMLDMNMRHTMNMLANSSTLMITIICDKCEPRYTAIAKVRGSYPAHIL